jgi:hypothetical protein
MESYRSLSDNNNFRIRDRNGVEGREGAGAERQRRDQIAKLNLNVLI